MEASCRYLVQENQDLQEDNVPPSKMDILENYVYEELHINELPDSILFHVFSHLSFTNLGKVSQVCHSWRAIAKDDLLWKILFLRYYKLPISTARSPRLVLSSYFC